MLKSELCPKPSGISQMHCPWQWEEHWTWSQCSHMFSHLLGPGNAEKKFSAGSGSRNLLLTGVYRPINMYYSKNNNYHLSKYTVCHTPQWVLYMNYLTFVYYSKCDWWALNRDQFWAQRRMCWLCMESSGKAESWWVGRSSLDLESSINNLSEVWRNLVHFRNCR